jgi:ABC-type dipeptide/oligopeptide/nickel transport system permease subunit
MHCNPSLHSIPTLFLLLIIVALFSPDPIWFVVMLGLLVWMGISRLVRGEVFRYERGIM